MGEAACIDRDGGDRWGHSVANLSHSVSGSFSMLLDSYVGGGPGAAKSNHLLDQKP